MSNKAQSDLAYIRELMVDTRRAAGVSGAYFILWGVLVGLGLLATWLQVIGVLPYKPLLTWGPVIALGILGNILLMRREMQEPVQTPAGRLIGMVWVAVGVTQLIFFYAGLGTGALPGEQMPAVFSSLIGTGLFLTGVLACLGWLRNMAFGWWAGSLLMFLWPGEHVIALMGLMLLVFYVLPGIVLIRMKQTPAAEA